MKKHAEGFLSVVNRAKAVIRETNVAEIKKRQGEGDTSFRLIDVREDREWALGHIPGAEHIGKGVIERDVEKIIPDLNEEVVLYCGGGFRSALAAESLQQMGYTNVLSMDGGVRGWKEAGFEMVPPAL